MKILFQSPSSKRRQYQQFERIDRVGSASIHERITGEAETRHHDARALSYSLLPAQ